MQSYSLPDTLGIIVLSYTKVQEFEYKLDECVAEWRRRTFRDTLKMRLCNHVLGFSRVESGQRSGQVLTP